MKIKWVLENIKAKKYNEPAPENPTDYGIYYKEFGDGWNDLVIETLEKMLKITYSEYIEIVQIKEKFAGLRIYYDFYPENIPKEEYNKEKITTLTEEINKIIAEAEEKSYKTCEQCGKPGKINSKGWRIVQCKEHWIGDTSFEEV